MKNKRSLSAKEAAFELGISVKTVQRWDEAGTLRTVRTGGNQRRIPIGEIARLRRRGEGKQGAERCVLYARVASGSQEQEGHLAQQTERLKEAARARGYEVVQIITEQASSLNEQRSGMNSLLRLIGAQAADVLLVEYPETRRPGCNGRGADPGTRLLPRLFSGPCPKALRARHLLQRRVPGAARTSHFRP